MKYVLHIGSGGQKMPEFLEGYQEITLDIDPSTNPDVVADARDLGDIGLFDAVYASHVLEHFTPTDGQRVLAEIRRVLKPGGVVVLVVPNLEGVLPTKEVLYESEAGPITGLDMYYGKWDFIDHNPYMAHKTGFVPHTLEEAMCCFDEVIVRPLAGYNLMAVGAKL